MFYLLRVQTKLLHDLFYYQFFAKVIYNHHSGSIYFTILDLHFLG